MSDTWYYAADSRSVGPFTLSELKAALERKPDWPNILVWRNGCADWQPAGMFPELRTLGPKPPPVPYTDTTALAQPPSSASAQRKWGVNRVVKGVVGFIALLLALAVGKVIGRAVYEFATTPSKSEMERSVGDSVAKMRSTLPKKLDEYTTARSVRHDGMTIIYESQVTFRLADIDEAGKKKLQEQVTQHVCTNSDTRTLLFQLGGAFKYVYHDIDNKLMHTVYVAKGNCR